MYFKFNKRGARVGFALLGGLCVSVPLFRCTSARAYAVEQLQEYTLTAQQAIALYGSEIELEIYANNGTYKKNATLVGTTSALTALDGYPVTNGAPNPPVTYAFGTFYDNTYDWMNINRMQHTEYLIYKITIDPWSQPYGMPFSVNITNSIDIQAYGFGTSILWSVYQDAGYAPNSDASNPYYTCKYSLCGASDEDIITNGGILAAGDISGSSYMNYASIATMPWGIQIDPVNELYFFYGSGGCNSYYGAVSFAGSQVSGGSPVTVGSQIIYIKNESNIIPYDLYDRNTSQYLNSKYQLGDSSDWATYIFVQCPTLYGDYVLPGGGESGGVDLSQIEEYLDEQTGYLQNISEESTVQTRQLIAILAKLEQIYQKIPTVPDYSNIPLHTTPNLPEDSQAISQIESALSNAENLYPDTSDLDATAVSGVSGLFGMVWDVIPTKVFFLISLALIGSLVSWVLFRG